MPGDTQLRLSIRDVCHILGQQGDWEGFISGAKTDSGKVTPGDLFVCLKGQRVDGHDYAREAQENGAIAILCSRPVPEVSIPCIQVEDVVDSLGQLAGFWRTKTRAKVICVTGTAGKTTFKDALASVMTFAGKKITVTKGNHNNQIGMPCTILSANGEEDFWILEAGISHAGDMDDLGRIARPDVAVILNVGAGHCEGLGQKGVAWHKARLLNYLAQGGQALVSADYPGLMTHCSDKKTRNFSRFDTKNTEFRCVGGNFARGEYILSLGDASLGVDTPFLGEHGAETAVAVAACAYLCGIAPEDIKGGLANAKLPEGRFQCGKCGDWRVYNDTYNANPLSMWRMLQTVSASAKNAGSPWYAVLGEMGELGNEANEWHRKLGELLFSLAPGAIFWKGQYFDEIKEPWNNSGRRNVPILHIESPDDFKIDWEKLRLPPGEIIFKGSRMNRLEDILGVFEKWAECDDVL